MLNPVKLLESSRPYKLLRPGRLDRWVMKIIKIYSRPTRF